MDSKTYDVAPGVTWINGQRVPRTRKVKLTQSEAAFDLANGRLSLVVVKKQRRAKPAPQKPASAETEVPEVLANERD